MTDEFDFGKVLAKVPDETKAAVLAFVQNWFSLIAKLAYRDLCILAERIRDKNYRGAFQLLMIEAKKTDPYLLNVGKRLEQEYKDMADENAELRKAGIEAAEIVLKLIGMLLIPILL